MQNIKILLITDNYELAKTWVPGLSQLRARVSTVSYNALPDRHDMGQYDLIIIDTYTTNFDIIPLCRDIRTHFQKLILVLTYERDERLHLLLYDSGVDESIVKPLGVPFFLAKVSAWLRRVEHHVRGEEQLRTAHFSLEPNRKRLVTAKGESLRLSTLECRLLSLLMTNQGYTLETDLIIARIWSSYGTGDKDLLKNLIYRLRRKIEPDPASPQFIHTVNGHGYMFRAE